MATKIQIRRGNASAIPALDVAEPGWDVDTKTLRVGDGTSNPARVPTTKSNGSFDFPSITDMRFPRLVLGLGAATAVSLYFHPSDVDSGIYSPGTHQVAIATGGVNRLVATDTGVAITGSITVSGTVDGVDISLLNPSNVNGIMVKTGNNAYAFRNLVHGNGIAPMLNNANQANAGGATGDIIIALANNPTIPGKGALRVPVGTTGDRSEVSALDGHFRYNTTSKAFEARIDGEWRSLVDYVEGKTLLVPSQMPSIQDALQYFSNRIARSIVTISLEAGTHPVSTTLSPGSVTTRVAIKGATPVSIALHSTPITNVSGTPGNWLVTYKLATALPVNITTDHSIIIEDLNSSGDQTRLSTSSRSLAGINSANKAQVIVHADYGGIGNDYTTGDYIMICGKTSNPEFRRVTAITNATTLTVDSAFTTATGANFHRRLKRLTGTISASGTTTVTGSGTSFQTEVNVGDMFYLVTSKQMIRVEEIASNTSMTISLAATFSGEIALQFANSDPHYGCWKISSIDTIANTVTVINTTWRRPPTRYGVKKGSIIVCPSTILYTSSNLMVLDANEYIRFQDVTLRYTGVTPTSNGFAIDARFGAIVQNAGRVGISGAGVYVANGAVMSFDRMFISGYKNAGQNGLYIGGVSQGNGNWLVVSGCSGAGVAIIDNSNLWAAYCFVSGHASKGLIVRNSQAGAAFLRSTDNGSIGIELRYDAALVTKAIDSVDNVGSGLDLYLKASVYTEWGGSLLAGNGANNLIAVLGSSVYMRQSLCMSCPKNNIQLNYSSHLYGYGINADNAASHSINVYNGSNAYLADDCLIRGDHHAMVAVGSSTIVIINSYVKTRSSSSSRYDLYAASSSSIFAVGCTGHTKRTPALDGVPGNRNSIIASKL